MANAQKTIVLTSAVSIILSILYPPFRPSETGAVIGRSKWAPIIEGVKRYPEYYGEVNFLLLGLEIFGILFFSCVAFYIVKKANQSEAMAGGITIKLKYIFWAAMVLIMIVLALCPYGPMGSNGVWAIAPSGWTSIDGPVNWIWEIGYWGSRIRFDVLSIEIFGILVLAAAALLITRKR